MSSPWLRLETHMKLSVEYLAALQPVLMLSLELIESNAETLLLLRRDG